MEESMKVSHEFKECKDNANSNTANKTAVICVGSTGTGKSSLIKLYCGDNVVVGHDVNSATQRSSLFESAKSGCYWLDSQGANDSQGVEDKKVLTDVLKTLYNNNITSIKVVWCISGDFDRAKMEFQTQAKFIKSLGENVWKSCMIIEKKGPIAPDDIDGVLEAARMSGCDIVYGDNRLFGYTGLDYMTDEDKKKDKLLKKIFKHTTPNTAERTEELLEDGYLTNAQIVQYVDERLSRLSSLSITFTVKECEKCGIKGDPRFVYAPCHSEIEKYHPKDTSPYHNGKLSKIHVGSLQPYHSEPKINNIHTGNLVYSHPGSWTTTYSWEYYHSGSLRYRHIFGVRITEYTWSCCGRTEGGTKCKSREVSSSSYSCCGSTSSSGCRGRYTCCDGSSGSTGCREEWECCKLISSNSGCQQKYGCCGGSVNSEGCKEEWDCCKAPKDGTGCARKYECCEEDDGADGCKDRCKACNVEWGDGPGCIKTTEES